MIPWSSTEIFTDPMKDPLQVTKIAGNGTQISLRSHPTILQRDMFDDVVLFLHLIIHDETSLNWITCV